MVPGNGGIMTNWAEVTPALSAEACKRLYPSIEGIPVAIDSGMPIASQIGVPHVQIGNAVKRHEEAAPPNLCQAQSKRDGHPWVDSQVFESALHAGGFSCLYMTYIGPQLLDDLPWLKCLRE